MKKSGKLGLPVKVPSIKYLRDVPGVGNLIEKGG